MIDTLRNFFEDYKKPIIGVVLAVVVGLFLWVVLSEGKEGEVGGEEEVINAKERAEELSKVFSELGSYDVSVNPKFVAYEVNLFLKEPFITSYELENYINEYIELLKWKVNGKDRYLTGLRLNIYDREIMYEDNLEPNGVIEYKLREEDKKKKKAEDEYMAGTDMRWEHTITQTKEPDYDKYTMVIKFGQMKEELGVTPLSNEEFEFMLKLLKYQALAGGNLENAVRVYLHWDLGLVNGGLVERRVEKEFVKFVDRHKSLGGNTGYYTEHNRKIQLVEEMAVDNPRFLVYALTKEIIDDKLEAKKRLIEIDKDLYLEIFIEDAKQKVKDGDFDITSQEAIKGLDDSDWETINDFEGGENGEDDPYDLDDLTEEDWEELEDGEYEGEELEEE